MKALLFQNPAPDKNSFVLQEDLVPHFYDKLHYHPELQLTLILEAEGTRFVGSSISPFASGEVYLLGANLPHVFRCGKQYYRGNKNLKAHGMSIYFQPGCFGEHFFDLPEAKKIKKLIQESAKGIIFSGKARAQAAELIPKMKEQHGFEKLCSLLELLRILSESPARKILSGVDFRSELGDENNKRLHSVYKYLANNFHEEIKLQKLAELAHMSPTALCRFFKQRTRKTIFAFLIEVRIAHACKLINEKKLAVSEIAYACGYNNISNFNRQFLLVTGKAPRRYLQELPA